MNETLEIAARLKPIRLPSEFATFGLSDCLVIFGLGLLIGLGALLLWRLVIAKDPNDEERVAKLLVGLRSEPAETRLLQLARLHAELDPGGKRPPWRDALYRNDIAPDFAGIERDVLGAARRRVDKP